MLKIKEGPAAKVGRAGVHLDGEHAAYTKNRLETQSSRLAIDPSRALGAQTARTEYSKARVATYRTIAGTYFVKIINPPWGWSGLDRECLSEAGADKYAAKLNHRLRIARQQEEARQARLAAARRRERNGKAGDHA